MATASEPPFRYLGGDPAVDFVNTVDWEAGVPIESERLRDYAGLLAWAEGAGVISAAIRRSLARRARERPAEAATVLRDALALRELLESVFGAAARGERLAPAQLARLNGLVRVALARRELRGTGPPLGWSLAGEGEALASPLWQVALAAADLLASEEIERLKTCAGPRCGWMYVDRSRNGLRRWCSMEQCGSRAKARRHYARQRGQG
ncbi:MAG: CGNR zinc finger domain-containing protein [Gemmatimonadales bacterium]